MSPPRRRKLGDTLAQMTSDALVSIPLIAAVTCLNAILGIVQPRAGYDVAHSEVNLFLLPLVSLPSAVIASTSIVLVWYSILRHFSGFWRILMTFCTYFVSGLILGALLAVGGGWLVLGGTSELDFLERVLVNALQMLVIMSLGTLLVAASRRQRKALAELDTLRSSGEVVLAGVETSLASEEQQLAAFVQQGLDAELATISSDSLASAIADTERVAREVVRPLSHDLARHVPSADFPEVDPEDRLSTWQQFWETLPVAASIQPFWSTIVIFLLTLAPSYLAQVLVQVIGGFPVFIPPDVAYLFAGAVLYGMLWLARLAGRNFWRITSSLVRFALLLLILILAVVPLAAMVLYSIVNVSPDQLNQASNVMVEGPLAILVIAALAAIRDRADHTEAQVVVATERLAWLRARAHLIRWYNHGKLARAVHGPVQSELIAAIADLRLALDEPVPDSEALTELGPRLEKAISAAVAVDPKQSNVSDAVEQARALWNGVADVSVADSADISTKLIGDPPAADLTVSIMQDAISNAVRHGGATKVAISLSSPDASQLVLTIENNGRGEDADGTHKSTGLTTTQLADCSIHWTTQSMPTGYALRAVLPTELAPQVQKDLAASE